MNLLDTASLVVTPNGYKASKLYSIIPSDGTGDMTFARTGDTATRVNSSGLIESVLANKPRLDYLGSTCPKLLLEPQRTNLLTYSNAFENAAWTSARATITANSTISPDGTQNADTFVSSSGQSVVPALYVTNITYTGSTAYTTSLFVKKLGTENNFSIFYVDNATGYVGGSIKFNVSTQTFTIIQAANGSVSGKITDYGNGWLRLQMTFTTIATPTFSYLQYGIDTALTTNGFAIYGAQLEAGTYATSYIPTTTASVTRNADSCYKASITSLVGQTEGTIFLNFTTTNIMSDSETLLNLSDNGANNYIRIYSSLGRLAFISYTAGSVGIAYNIATALAVGTYKVAIAYKANDVSIYFNGTQIYSLNSFSVPAMNKLNLASLFADIFYANIKVSSSALWKTRLQNSELATLTSL